jgi:CheY-like chemotaxis protein
VLLVEVDVAGRETLRQMLEHEGVLVTEASSAEQAIGLARSLPFNAVITNLSLGEGVRDGRWLLHRLRSIPRIPPVPVIAVTDQAGHPAAGFFAVLMKPLDAREFAAVVRGAGGALFPL